VNTPVTLAAALLAGVLLGVAFYGGLWATVRHLPAARHPAAWLFASLALRFGLVLAGFLALARLGGWAHVLAAVPGFLLPRMYLAHRLESAPVRSESGK
jgi:F1F0 ATPase subunit 2